MRIRIIKAVRGDLDGIPLASFQVGHTYDVSPSLGTYLIMEGRAEPLMDDGRPLEIPVDELRYAVPDEKAQPGVAADEKNAPQTPPRAKPTE